MMATHQSGELPRDSDGGPRWRVYAGKRATVHALDGSYAATRAEATLREADAVVEGLRKILEYDDSRAGDRIGIYLTDPVVSAPAGSAVDAVSAGAVAKGDGPALVRVVRPEAPGEPLAWPLAHLLMPHWFGEGVMALPLFIDGLAGAVAARTETGPSLKEADAWVRAERDAGHEVIILVWPPPDAADDGAYRQAATSFVGFLLASHGAEPMRRFLTVYDPQRRDQATLDVYHKTLGQLEEAWGTAIKQRQSESPHAAFMGHLVPLLKPHWRRELEVGLLMLFGLSYGVLLPLSAKYLVDSVVPSGNLRTLLLFLAVLFVIYLLNIVANTRRVYVTSWVNQRVMLQLQERMFAHLQRLSHDYYADAKLGDVMTRLSTDLQVAQQALDTLVGTGVFLLFRALVASITIIILSWLLGLLVLLVMPIFLISFISIALRLREASRQRQRLLGEVATATQENLSAHTVIKAFGMESRAVKSYHARLMELLRAVMHQVVLGSLFEASASFATSLGQIVVLGVGGYLVITGHLTVGTLLAFIALLPSLFEPIAAFFRLAETLQSVSGSLDRITELINEPVAVADQPGAVALEPLSRDFRLDGVTFAYGGSRPVINDLSLTIPAGAQVAIVGPSGSGKSTVINLLMRFWDPEQGRVLFDDHDVRQATLASLRGQIGIVFQDTFVFDTTLRENIAVGLPGATDDQIAAAVAAAHLDEYVRTLPNGYDTVLGERGILMSGGQRQRLAIARALLRDPHILIFDEATSALDAATERGILETIGAAATGRTTISITHRLAQAAMADTIFVLDRGRLVEQGSHAELAAAGGLYQQLYEEQIRHTRTGARARPGIDISRLQRVPIFSSLADTALAALADRVMLEHYAANEDVVRRGEVGDKMFMIHRGQADVLLKHGGMMRRLNTLNDGDFFGEMALLAGEPRNATVRTTIPTEFYSLSQEDFKILLEQEPAVHDAIMATITERQAALAAATDVSRAGSAVPPVSVASS